MNDNDTVGPVRVVPNIRSKSATQEFRDGWERTFGSARAPAPESAAALPLEVDVDPGTSPTRR